MPSNKHNHKRKYVWSKGDVTVEHEPDDSREATLRDLAHALREAKAPIYVLKNHNGSILMKDADLKKIGDEMLRYESQTGNKTSIAVER